MIELLLTMGLPFFVFGELNAGMAAILLAHAHAHTPRSLTFRNKLTRYVYVYKEVIHTQHTRNPHEC